MAPLGKAWSLNLAIAFGKGLLLFWASRSCSGTAAAIVNPANNLLKWNGASPGPGPWKIVEKLFFNKGLIRDWLLWERLGVWIWQLPVEKACFSSGLPGAALAQLAAIVNQQTNLLKWNGASPGPGPWKIVEKLFFNKGLIRDWLLWERLGVWIWQFGKGLLPFWASRGCSGTACCNSEPSKQTYSDRDAFTGSDREMSKNLTELRRFWEKNASQQLQFFLKKELSQFCFATKANPPNNTWVSE